MSPKVSHQGVTRLSPDLTQAQRDIAGLFAMGVAGNKEDHVLHTVHYIVQRSACSSGLHSYGNSQTLSNEAILRWLNAFLRLYKYSVLSGNICRIVKRSNTS